MRDGIDVLRVAERYVVRLLVGIALGSLALLASACSSDASSEARVGAASSALTLGTLSDAGGTAVLAPTQSGLVVGRSDGNAASFLGIPYAAPPIGELRWRPPVPHPPWLLPRDASAFGSPCPQTGTLTSTDEDCLTLNVWAPAKREGLVPVMVFLHGGGFIGDTGSNPVLNGAALTGQGVVVVTLNYRLGQLGFLAHPALIAEDPIFHSAGNYGFLDQQLALRWVQANIAGFGGDPADVTLFGVSAGAISACAHLVAPSSAGLFRRVIQESNTCTIVTPLNDTPGVPYESAVSLGKTFAAAVGCDTSQDVAACLRSKSVSDVLAAAPRNQADLSAVTAHYAPNIDGAIFPTVPSQLLQKGRLNARTWIGGTNHDEGILFAFERNSLQPINTQSDYVSALDSAYPGFGSSLAGIYDPALFENNPVFAYAFFLDDSVTCLQRKTAQVLASRDGVTPYLYQFSRVSAIGAAEQIGAFHGAETPYVFGNFVAPYFSADFPPSATDVAISQFMMGAWTQFARSGNPNRPSQPVWSPYTTSQDDFMQIADTVSLQTGLDADRCPIFDSIANTLLGQEVAALQAAEQQ
jgi:para-nitrobenzyl esterase